MWPNEIGVNFAMKTASTRLLMLAAAATAVSGPASAAVQAQAPAYSPWAALSAFASPASSQALCKVGETNSVDGTVKTCLLPAADAAPGGQAAAATGAAAGNSFTIIPLLAGLAVLAGAVALLASGKESANDRIIGAPVSPA